LKESLEERIRKILDSEEYCVLTQKLQNYEERISSLDKALAESRQKCSQLWDELSSIEAQNLPKETPKFGVPIAIVISLILFFLYHMVNS
jgi:predicted  nucleic acid-binding Zn-ribbon protein